MASESSGSSQDSFRPNPSSLLRPENEGPLSSSGTTIPSVSTAHQEARIDVDGVFVQFLISYAASSPECPPLFKAYLEDVVLKPGVQDLRLKVEYHLRNPQIKDYNLGPTFIRELQRYRIYDHVYAGARSEGALPSAPIPAQYKPRAHLTAGRVTAESTELDAGGDLEEELEETESEVQDEDDMDDRIDRTGPDWEIDSWYKDKRQPPLAAPLHTVINFLADEDVDRCLNWEAKFEEVVSYLEWLAHDDDRGQLDNARPQTQAMFNDAVTKAKAHVLFEEHHYDPTPLEITKPPKNPLRSTRLNWMINGRYMPLPSRSSVPDRSNLLPKSIPPRPPSLVNRMLIDKPDNNNLYDEFARDEKEWWQRIADADDIPPDAEDDEQNNLAYIEDESFASSSRGDNNIGWVRTDPSTGQTVLPNGSPLPRGPNPQAWAMERGARRAGLQQLLRATSLTNPYQRLRSGLILPTPAATLRSARENADNNTQWTPPRLDPSSSQLPSQLETLPYTVAYRERLKQIKTTRELARLRVEEEAVHDMLLPRNLVNGGPFVVVGRRMTDPATQARQDLLKQCRTTVAMLKAAARRVPRALLKAVLHVVAVGETNRGRGRGGVPMPVFVPGYLVLAGDELEQQADGQERVPRLLDQDEVQWLRFLAGGECVNGKNWTGRFVPDTPRDKYRLFLLFATKVQKLLDDKNPQGLFSRCDAQVEVEDLLEAINAGKDSSAVTKYEFQPHDACCWLDRMKESGHVRFRLDLMCYGVVQRPVVEYFPEHRVLWPTEADTRERPSYYFGYLSDWRRIIQDGHKPDISEGSAIWNFFLSLAFRLGYTIAMLEQEQEQQPIPPPQAAVHNLRDSINKWKRACTTTTNPEEEPEPTRAELALIRTNIIDELGTNKTMLAPGRTHHYLDSAGHPQTTLIRDHNWDWAAAARQQPPQRRKQFWSIDRWPLLKTAINNNKDLDPYPYPSDADLAARDPTTDMRYKQPKLERYCPEKTEYRPGPAVYPVGDTRLQREVVRGRRIEMVERAIGLEPEEATWSDTLAMLNPFSRPSLMVEERIEDGKLPAVVDVKVAPRSWDPVAEAEAEAEAQAAGEVELDDAGEDEDDEDEDFEVQSLDILMTGMGEPWMTA
ncbi:hypothetical protein C8A00DRAFT_39882 [Chaetomidium leptoderma]|uniref:Uncharacterized protein n=1 Tax=Chaetomidium leptoderma TaxID=669021 RepID=A0AAN7A186_9PEZI|nr:hypothetical protein C8A00DRAFT_39882 [Chaetomidium leptoderma]